MDATGHAVIPGLHDTHLHSGLLRGTAESKSLWDWLPDHVDPAHKALTPEIAEAASLLCYRATLVPCVADLLAYDYFESLDTNRRLLEDYRTYADDRVRSWVGLEHVEESLRRLGRRPIEEFHHRGILGPRTVVAHCPCSNMKLSSGPARVNDMRRSGIAVGLGSDGEKENNNLDLLEEMKFASLLQKVTTLDPTTGDPWDILTMAPLEGARALDLDAVTGSLEPGKKADVVTVDLRKLHTTPLLHGHDFNAAAHLVFSAGAADVDQVWAEGRLLVDSGSVLTVDAEQVRQRAQATAEELFHRRAALTP